MSSILSHLDALERALIAKGFPPMSAWWREQVIRFYKSGRRQFVIRCGRRGGKSSSLCRLAVLEALYGDHTIPPGDVGVVAIVSERTDQAADRLATIRSILDAIGVKHRPWGGSTDGIRLEGERARFGFRVYTASIGAVSGFTAVCALCDEVAKWSDRDTSKNPATEVLSSLRPTLATQPNAKLFLSSSPLSTLDAHYDAFEEGDTDHQLVAYAPTWVAHPALTRDALRASERDPRTFAREYEAIPMSALSAAFDVDEVDRAMREPPRDVNGYRDAVMVIDPSSGRGDAFTHSWAQWHIPRLSPDDYVRVPLIDSRGYIIDPRGEIAHDENGIPLIAPEARDRVRPSLVLSGMGAWEGRFFGSISFDDIVASLARRCADADVWRTVGDQREELALRAAFARHRVTYSSIAWTNPEKIAAVAALRRHFAEGTIAIPNSEPLRRELHAFSEKVLPSGAITFGGRASAKDDRVALLLTAVMADHAGLLRGSPTRRRRARNDNAAGIERRQMGADERAA